jgi:hypothetical protein
VSRTSRILAVAVSAVLGVAAGVTTALVMDEDQAGDPLGLGVPLVNQSCTGRFLLVTATGTTESALGPGIPDDLDTVRYLSIGRSCPTAWRPYGSGTAGYATYLGPYQSARDACLERVKQRGSFVTKLRLGDQQAEQCLCFLPEESMPELTPGQVVDVADGVYVRMLGNLLGSMGLLSTSYHFSGRFESPIVGKIKTFQASAGIPPTGDVGQDTWHSLKKKGCQDLAD